MATLTWLGHSAFRVESDRGKWIYVDPFLDGNPKTPANEVDPDHVDVIAITHGVAGVIAVDLDFLYGGSAPLAQTKKSRQPRLLATRMHVLNGVPKAAEVMTLHPGPLARLEVM